MVKAHLTISTKGIAGGWRETTLGSLLVRYCFLAGMIVVCTPSSAIRTMVISTPSSILLNSGRPGRIMACAWPWRTDTQREKFENRLESTESCLRLAWKTGGGPNAQTLRHGVWPKNRWYLCTIRWTILHFTIRPEIHKSSD